MNFAKSARIRVKDQWSEIRGFGAALHNHRRKSVIFAKVLPRSPLEIRYSVAVEPSFPLTLTLSPGEREQPPPGACCAPTGLANSVAGMTPRGGGRFSLSPGERGRVRGKKMQPFQCSMFDVRCFGAGKIPGTKQIKGGLVLKEQAPLVSTECLAASKGLKPRPFSLIRPSQPGRYPAAQPSPRRPARLSLSTYNRSLSPSGH